MGLYQNQGDVNSNGDEEVTLKTAAGVELLGQQTMATSLPVVISSNQSTLPISAASLPLPSGAATETTLSSINTKVPSLGQTTMANSTPVTVASNQSAIPIKTVTPVSFSATMQKTAVGTTELNTLFLKNPVSSGKTLIIKQIILTNVHTVANSWLRWRCYSNPTTSANGSAITVGKMQVGLGTNAVATPFNTPTSSANGTQLLDSTVIAGQTESKYFDREFTIAENNTVMFTAVADSSSRVGSVTVIWTEE